MFWSQGQQRGLEFVTGYLIELSLSVDNLFVFILIFSYFKVPARYQHRVLFWGLLGALVFRLTMIFLGATLITHFHWILYVFGAFLVYTGLSMFREEDQDIQPEKNLGRATGDTLCSDYTQLRRGEILHSDRWSAR